MSSRCGRGRSGSGRSRPVLWISLAATGVTMRPSAGAVTNHGRVQVWSAAS